MQLILDTYKNTGTLHHAYCIEGDKTAVFATLSAFIEKELGFSMTGNPDYWHEEFDSFGIDDGRRIKEFHATKAFRQDTRKIFIISTNSITREAQNSLLKIFEEPGEGNHFFIIIPSASVLLPTLKSRVIVVQGDASSNGPLAQKAKLFLGASPKIRLEIVKELLDQIAAEEKTKADVAVFLGELERAFYKNKKMAELTKTQAENFEQLLKFRDYLNDRSASAKMILEHLALAFPR